jgi:Domain of unknown function (DUF4062)
VPVAGSDGSGANARWRVFISHTSELQDFPAGASYVAAVKGAVSAAGHVIVDMADFPAATQPPAQLSIDRVRSCEVYVGVLGTRYGSPVRGKPKKSYTELEFDTATEAGLDRLVFLLDKRAADVGIPLEELIDRKYGDRQDKFRRKVQASELTTQSFTNPDMLARLVQQSLEELAKTRRRIDSGIQREQVPTEPQLPGSADSAGHRAGAHASLRPAVLAVVLRVPSRPVRPPGGAGCPGVHRGRPGVGRGHRPGPVL